MPTFGTTHRVQVTTESGIVVKHGLVQPTYNFNAGGAAFSTTLDGATLAGALSVVLDEVPASLAAGQYLVIDANTVQAELRLVDTVTPATRTVTVTAALEYAHADGDLALVLETKRIRPEMWGAVGDCDPDDPAGGTNNYDAILATFTQLGDRGVMELTGFYRVAGAPDGRFFDLGSDIRVIGIAQRAGMFVDSAGHNDGWLFRVWKNQHDVLFEGLLLVGTYSGSPGAPTTSGKLIMVGSGDANSTGSPWETPPANETEAARRVRITWCELRNGMEGLWAGQFDGDAFAAYGPHDVIIENSFIYNCEHGINLQGTRGRIFISRCWIDGAAAGYQRPLLCTGAQGAVEITDVVARNSASQLNISAKDATLKNSSQIKLSGLTVIDCGGMTLEADSNNALSDVQLVNVSLENTALNLVANAAGTIKNVQIVNLTTDQTVNVENVESLSISGFESTYSAGPSIDMDGVTVVTISRGTAVRGAVGADCTDVYIDNFQWDITADTKALTVSGTVNRLHLSHCRLSVNSGGSDQGVLVDGTLNRLIMSGCTVEANSLAQINSSGTLGRAVLTGCVVDGDYVLFNSGDITDVTIIGGVYDLTFAAVHNLGGIERMTITNPVCDCTRLLYNHTGATIDHLVALGGVITGDLLQNLGTITYLKMSMADVSGSALVNTGTITNYAMDHIGVIKTSAVTGTVTIDVTGLTTLILNPAGALTVTNFTGHEGQILTVVAGAGFANVTVQNNANLSIGTNWVPAAQNRTLTIRLAAGVWCKVSNT